ncbi:MAG: RNA methyltransferase [Flavobacteriales bacterium]|nr:RNA methyltransferase [Flavobacteriales bacterium]
MVTKNQIKLINSLQQKKNRQNHNLFIAEGFKVISEFLKSDYELEQLFTTQPDLYANFDVTTQLINEQELAKISQLKTPNTSVALFRIKEEKTTHLEGAILALDTINDPGNMGTIIRLCDWFGIENIVCSEDTTDIYNPKVVQSTMGSLARVNVVYTDLKALLDTSEKPIYGTFMEGENIYKTQLNPDGIIVMGNEANGISAEIEQLITDRITIPRFGNSETESLNVATATAICLSELRRNA